MRKLRLPYLHFRNGRWIPPVLSCWLFGCVQVYESPYKSPPTGYLVVEGYISANTPTQYTLSRTIGLPGDSTIPVVTGALVQVEGSDNSVYPLPEKGNGIYGDTTLSLNPAIQYRLSIRSPKGERYLSDLVPVKGTPPIDSVNWTYSGTNGVNIYVNTHDPKNATRYYQWTYDQTWEYDMPQESSYIYDYDSNAVLLRQPDQLVNRCWENFPSTNVLIDNTTKLAQDIVYEFPLVNIPNNSQPLGTLYTIQVTQYALTSDGYNFLSQMEVNTESLGSLFDLQPTQLTGNIHCLNNPAEQVIGYISAGTVQQKRIWIADDQLPSWDYFITCPGPDIIVPNTPDSVRYYFSSDGYTPVSSNGAGWISGFSWCIDCTLLGGTNVKPSFWPY
jgi:hypothetical protein